MAIEIERKFLACREKLPPLGAGIQIEQGYIATVNGSTVRVRKTPTEAFLCIKSKPINFSRQEFEYQIPTADAEQMLQSLCISQHLHKIRYHVNFGGQMWEVDVFEGRNQGLIVAEIELQSEHQGIKLPPWVDEEVTLEERFSNYQLALKPYSEW